MIFIGNPRRTWRKILTFKTSMTERFNFWRPVRRHRPSTIYDVADKPTTTAQKFSSLFLTTKKLNYCQKRKIFHLINQKHLKK
nr:MAG TPA: hypothetical protein [Caudoviricetes sp.]